MEYLKFLPAESTIKLSAFRSVKIRKMKLGEMLEYMSLRSVYYLNIFSGKEKESLDVFRRAMSVCSSSKVVVKASEVIKIIGAIDALNGIKKSDEKASDDWIYDLMCSMGELGYSQSQVLDMYMDTIPGILRAKAVRDTNRFYESLQIAHPEIKNEEITEMRKKSIEKIQQNESAQQEDLIYKEIERREFEKHGIKIKK